MIATDNTKVVSCINKQGVGDRVLLPTTSSCGLNPGATLTGHSPQGQTHSGLQQCDRRHNQSIITVWHLHLEIAALIFELWGLPTEDNWTCSQHSPQPQHSAAPFKVSKHWRWMHGHNPGRDGRCTSRLVAVSAVDQP